ncbi:alpha/beta-hydrolase [Tilletiaria anomala UBC 951]|uniref:Pheromone-processing carboxypeptidase KEX1 n=1 Tax=Tilletiaria anomala (strain ATCC 24038 / CBS 436.72 / UBC 951) TaxID=1037660 RepID=A0A066W6R6_TILAU|nr:alpha/beta-hydrolase [Tilletiaria anomala UBC 951]KDN46769.1 alpha/beta-hydrolase [Tilletiaria anomala UBC 951]
MASPRAIPSASAADFWVSSVPTLPDALEKFQIYAGDLPARPPARAGDNAHIYFMLHKAKHTADKRRLLLWMNGGPGCSSFDGVMMEIGAWRTKADGTGLEWAQEGGAWNEYVDVLYLDQPVGTGFSYVSTNAYASTLSQAADEVKYFLERFVEVFPEYKRGNGADAYIVGESFAGQYIPYTARSLVQAGGSSPVDLKGIAIGNGFIDPRSQYGSEIDLLVERNVWQKGGKEYNAAMASFVKCQEMMRKTPGNPRNIPFCESLLPQVIDLTKDMSGGQAMCINIYDVRLADTMPECGMNWPPNLHATYDFLHRQDVRKAFNVNEKQKPEAWIECNKRVGSALSSDTEDAAVTIIPGLLEHNIQVLIFAGDQDLICNHIGLERMIDNLEWNGRRGFSSAASTAAQQWYVNETVAGSWRTERNLTYVSVAGASHMVGYDVPIVSHDMMLRWMNVDLLSAAGPSARIPSRLGNDAGRELVIGGAAGHDVSVIPGSKSTEQAALDAKWEAYYQAGSAALVILLLMLVIGSCIILRLRRAARKQGTYQAPGSRGISIDSGADMELDRLVENADVEDEADARRSQQLGKLEEERFVIHDERQER